MLILALSASAKSFDLFIRKPKYIHLYDPVILAFQRKHSMMLAVLVEFLALFVLILPVSQRIKASVCIWLSLCFIAYHMISRFNEPGGACECFGYLLSGIGLSKIVSQGVVYALIGILLGAGLKMLFNPQRNSTPS